MRCGRCSENIGSEWMWCISLPPHPCSLPGVDRVDSIEVWPNGLCQPGEPLELFLSLRLLHKALRVLLRRPLSIVHHLGAIEAAVNAHRYEAGLIPDRALG